MCARMVGSSSIAAPNLALPEAGRERSLCYHFSPATAQNPSSSRIHNPSRNPVPRIGFTPNTFLLPRLSQGQALSHQEESLKTMKTVYWSLPVGCSISLFCLAQVNEVASQEATSPGSSTVTNSLGSGGLTNTSGVTTTADIIAMTNALAAKTTTTTTTTITPISVVQYLTPSEWAAVTNGINPGDLS